MSSTTLQSQDIDSIRAQYALASDPTGIANQCMALGKAYLYKNQDSAAYYFNAGRNALPDEGYDSLYVRLYERNSALEEFRGNIPEALRLAHLGLVRAIQSDDQWGISKLYSVLGRYHMRVTHYDSATYYWNLLLEKYELEDDQYSKWVPYHLLAEMHKNLGDWTKSKDYFDKSLASVRLEKKPKDYLFLLYNYIIACEVEGELDLYSQLKDEYLSFKHEQGMDILSPEHSAMTRINETPAQLRKRLLTFLPFHLKNNSHFSACDSYYHLGKSYLEEKKYDDAILAFTNMLATIDSLDFLSLKYAGHAALAQAYAAKADYKKALYHYQLRYALHDSLMHLENLRQMNELNIKYETVEKEKQLAETTLHLESARINQRLMSLVLLGALIISGLSIYAFRTKIKSNKQLEEKNRQISKALQEKDILLREIHHRVKNNLQMISALLYLHGKSVDDSTAQEALMESQNRVQSMAMIHQNLYQDENLLGVSIKDYLDKLLNHLISSYNIEKDRITILKKIDIPQMDVDTVIPLALIINELISNALKYAFRDGRRGEIKVSLQQTDGLINLEVSDNGMGLPENFSVESSSNFGLKLINILCDRLGATWSAQSGKGTRIDIHIPLKIAA
ncbi:MAG TPA: sensor histidine kinase [Saprospiraceae bacterium]|nr:sensor histidine kinase [Saprospiraceae bacterium]